MYDVMLPLFCNLNNSIVISDGNKMLTFLLLVTFPKFNFITYFIITALLSVGNALPLFDFAPLAMSLAYLPFLINHIF